MTKKKDISMQDAVDKLISSGTPATIRKVLTKLSAKSSTSKGLIRSFNATQMDSILEKNHINDDCPHCHAKAIIGGELNIIKNGKYKNGMQRFHCKACKQNFNRLTKTFLAETTFSFDYWVELIWLELSLMSLKREQENLTSSGFATAVYPSTLWSQRMKLMAATHKLQPNLSGIVEIDEYHIREAQKGETTLVNYLNPKEERKARYSYKPSKMGVKGAEFVTIVCAVDNSKNYFSFVSGFGALKEDVFKEYVVSHIKDAIWLCSDANVIYTEYSQRIGLPHYVKNSHYSARYKECKTDKDKENYYKKGLLDYILNYDNRMTYKKFQKVRDDNHLSIAHVNEFHKDIKYNLEDTRNGINLEYVQFYMDWITYLKNIAKDLGMAPTTKAHAEYILIDILKRSTETYTIQNLKDLSGIKLPKPSRQFTTTLVKETESIRKVSGNKNYVFTPEDIGESFSVKKQLEKLSVSLLKEMGKDLHIKGYTKAKTNSTWKLKKALEAHPDIKDELRKIRAKYPSKFNDKNEVK